MLRFPAALAVAALVLVGCGDGGSTASPAPTPLCEPVPESTPSPEGILTCTMTARVTIEVEGAETFQDSGEYVLALNEFLGGDLPKATWFANLGMASPQNLTETKLYRVAWDVAPGTYRGDGTYELTDERPDVEGLSSPLTSRAVLEVTTLEQGAEPLRIFERFGEPCELVVQDSVTRGTLSCSDLRAEQDEPVSLRFSWEPAS